jgi:hypothetical protein
VQRVCRRKKTNRSSSHAMSARIGRCKETLAKKRSRGAKDVCIRVTRDGPERPKRRETAYASVSKRGAKETEQRGQRDGTEGPKRPKSKRDCVCIGVKRDLIEGPKRPNVTAYQQPPRGPSPRLLRVWSQVPIHACACQRGQRDLREGQERLCMHPCQKRYASHYRMHPCQKRPNRGAKDVCIRVTRDGPER